MNSSNSNPSFRESSMFIDLYLFKLACVLMIFMLTLSVYCSSIAHFIYLPIYISVYFHLIIHRYALFERGLLVYDAFRAFNSSNSGLLSCSELYGALDFLGSFYPWICIHVKYCLRLSTVLFV